ncbi:hypothetical protein AB0O91_28755 [Kitasatospora sp. NPDC089797]|uniref:hypothetical protein n=1 Tax=Kitasatospora sp. NPDC089797 TaxID=3155298 RepID=UPI0034493393
MAAHPLAALRASTGLSQAAYAQLIARTHAELGHGRMAARREKVSRWESGRIAPEFSAQLAIARIHQVDSGLVLRLGWPQWLTAATGDHSLLRQPWTPRGAIAVSRSAADTAAERGSGPIATGPSLDTVIRGAVAALDSGSRPPERDGPRIAPETLFWAEGRIRALEELEAGTTIPPDALHLAARTEHRLISDLLTRHGYDRATGTRLLLLAARTATLCTWTSYVLGEEARTERYNLAAIRAACAAGASHHAAAFLTQLCFRHHHRGRPQDVLSLLRAARTVVSRTTPRLAVLLHTHRALALARLAEPAAGLRALEHAERAFAAAPRQWDPEAEPTGGSIDEGFLTVSRGHAWLHLGQPARALSCFGALTGDGASADGPPTPYAVIDLCLVVEAQLAADRIEEAVATVRRAVDRAGTLPPGVADRFRDLLAPHAGRLPVPEIQDLLYGRSEP